MQITNRKANVSDEIGINIKKLRLEKNMSQKALGERLNVSRACIANWENGTRLPDCNHIIKLAGIFCVPIDYIYGLTDHKYVVNVPDYFELDLTKLNPKGQAMLYEYYKYLEETQPASLK